MQRIIQEHPKKIREAKSKQCFEQCTELEELEKIHKSFNVYKKIHKAAGVLKMITL